MSSSTIVTDLADLRRDLITRVSDVTGNSDVNTLADRMLNTALHDIHMDPNVHAYWAVRRAYIQTHAAYSTGTIDITAAARTTVTGTSTAWNTAVTGMGFNNTRVGGKMTFQGSSDVFNVTAVGSDTSITIDPRWLGDALSAATYTYFEDEYALASDFLRPVDLRNFSTDWDIPILGPMEFRRKYVRNSLTGQPMLSTVFQLAFSGSTSPRHRVAFYPSPDDEYNIPYNYVTSNLAVSNGGAEQTQLSATTDEPIVPLGFRHIIVLHALYNWYRDIGDDSRSQEAKAEYIDMMQRMIGTQNIGRDRPRIRPTISRYLPKSRPLGRFDVNNRFDQMRDWK